MHRLVALYRAQGPALAGHTRVRRAAPIVLGIIVLTTLGMLLPSDDESQAPDPHAEATRVIFAAPVPDDTEGPRIVESEARRRAPHQTAETGRSSARRKRGGKRRRHIELSQSETPWEIREPP